MATPGINGLAVGLGVAGFVVAYSGIKNATVSETIRSLLRSQPVEGSAEGSIAQIRASAPAAPGGGAAGAAIVAEARRYLGRPYLFGKAGPEKFDCSGLVNRVLSDLGLPIPGSPSGKFSNHGPVSGQYYVWTGAPAVADPKTNMQAGDLLCWIGHIAIATGPSGIIHATGGAGKVVERSAYWVPMPIVRRVAPAGVVTV